MESNSATSQQEQQPTAQDELFLVGLGASAGGLEPLEQFFDKMPQESGLAFVVVQHLSPDFKSLMDQLLARHTKIRIEQATDGVRIERNTIYLLPPKHNLAISDGCLQLTQYDASISVNLPIDVCFTSMAEQLGRRAIGIVLSGTGSDGSRGAQAIHDAGGLVIAQDLSSAAFDGMPLATIKTGAADIVCPPAEMAGHISTYVAQPEGFDRSEFIRLQRPSENGENSSIFHMFRVKFGVDFSLYKPATIQRRLERRVEFSRCDSLGDYIKKLESDPAELDLLYRDLLVEVTHFFRDPKAFEILREIVIPKMVDETQPGRELRIWTAGCATGEEAYSLAILFDYIAKSQNKQIPFKVFASDVHQSSMDFAAAGCYGIGALETVPEEFHEYFQVNGDVAAVIPSIRRRVVFARHDITMDPPFTRLDFLSCRNVLIYLEPEVQQQILASFHFGLRVGGVLFLGPSETTGPLAKEFEQIDQHWRIYRKQRDTRLVDPTRLSNQKGVIPSSRGRTDTGRRYSQSEDSLYLPPTFEDLLAKHVPPSLLVNEFYDLLHTFGDARNLLTQPTGRTTLDVTKMVEGDLRTAIIAALHRSGKKHEPIIFRGVRASTPTGEISLTLTVEPYDKGTRKVFLICFEREDIDDSAKAEVDGNSIDFNEENRGRLEELERELDHTRQSLQTTVEELETSNEELQSTNEELIASNEELQSTNEELHSVNEELYTVNAEYQRKITELTDTTNDLDNLLNSTDIGTIFLDSELRIRKFTSAASEVFHLLDSDVGRPIQHIAYNLLSSDLESDLKLVLRNGQPIERQVKARDGKHYLKRVRPYQAETGDVKGLVLTFDNITALHHATADVLKAREKLSLSQNELQEFVYAVSHDFQSPLRHIDSHSKEMITGQHVDETGMPLLEVVHDSAEKLQQMIQALLQYSRIYSQGKEFDWVELDEVLEESLQDLQDQIKTSQAEINHSRLPRVRGDADQLRRAFTHLLDNALKYRGEEKPQVFVELEERDKHWLIAIHDNGIGIERRHYDRIFVIFQRLGFKRDVPGIGIGLPLVRRILERHDCFIWVESTPGHGSTFFIQLPRENG